MTGIPIEYDKELLEKAKPIAVSKTSKNNDRMIYFKVIELKSKKGKDRLDWKGIVQVMAEKQEKGEITHHLHFKTTKLITIQKWFSRMKKELEIEEIESQA